MEVWRKLPDVSGGLDSPSFARAADVLLLRLEAESEDKARREAERRPTRKMGLSLRVAMDWCCCLPQLAVDCSASKLSLGATGVAATC